MFTDETGAKHKRRRPPGHPSVGQCHPLWIGSTKREMPGSIERKSSTRQDTWGNAALRLLRAWIRTWADRQYSRFPAILGKITRELHGSMNSASAAERRIVVRDHQDFFHEETLNR